MGGYQPPADSAVHLLGDPQLGDPELTSAQRIGFASGGVLLVSDGASDRVVAIETGDVDTTSRSQHVFERVDQLAKRISTALTEQGGAEVWVHDVAINPLSWRVYVAATRYDTGEVAILWVDGDGQVHPMPLGEVIYAAASYSMPSGGGASTGDLAWSEGQLVGSVSNQVGRLLAVESPVEHGTVGKLSSPRFYHASWGGWLEDLPADGLFVLEHNGTPWMVAAFADGPMVRFGVGVVALGLPQSVGTTFADFGIGRLVRDMAYHEQGGEAAAVMLVYDYWNDVTTRGVRVARSMLMQVGAVNAEAPLLLDYLGNPVSPLVERLEDLDAAERMAPVPGRAQVVVLRQDALEWVELPD